MKTCILCCTAGLLVPFAKDGRAAVIEPVSFRVPARMPDVAEPLSPSAVHLDGWLGERIAANARNRLLEVDTEPLLAGFRNKPGTHPWIGEHVGKWMHAATLAWAYTGDRALREKLDRVAAELIRCQEPDGYLGTYAPEKRFGLHRGADWDVWSHKYNLIGLLTYHRYTGHEPALQACRKMGDLLLKTFGPDKKSILSAGTHVGMAATSVLEPMVLLYRLTGDERYLGFGQYIVNSWDEPNGPRIVASLLEEKQVNKTANRKAYEMLSNLVGLCELGRATGDRRFLEPVMNAWSDIVAKRLYLTGSASQGEHFHDDHELPNHEGAHVAETCVTTTWVQLNLQLLRLTGEARFGHQLERTFYNHLAAAQHPRGDDWCYFTPLEGKKAYRSDINCCHSSGPRGMALAPPAAYLRIREGTSEALAVSTFETSRATLSLSGRTVAVEQQSQFPRRGVSVLTFRVAQPVRLGVKIRTPSWAAPLRLQANGQSIEAQAREGWTIVPPREWRDGDQLHVTFSLGAAVVIGEHTNADRAALLWGPFVLAYDQSRNPGLPGPSALGLAALQKPPFEIVSGDELMFQTQLRSRRSPNPVPATFVTFADAGSDGGAYRVWLRAPGVEWAKNDSVLADGTERRSRQGNLHGSIIDGDLGSVVVTFNGQPARQDWYAVTLEEPVRIARVVFVHGRTFHDGGWFNARVGKPVVQVQRTPNGAWETVAELTDYPATTASDSRGLRPGQKFVVRLAEPISVAGVRVMGAPACGDNPKQAFSSCAELEAFLE